MVLARSPGNELVKVTFPDGTVQRPSDREGGWLIDHWTLPSSVGLRHSHAVKAKILQIE
jgi:hypothetical protein